MYTLFIPTTGQFLQVWGDLDAAKHERVMWAKRHGISSDRITIYHKGREIKE